ncbi:hypothetical protein NPIL_628791 [Nephila pilipes]|uniref:Uncharacterized protein n=1 Tax=Nephila pilipes TaxID=299642 RepID=A0A8X6U7C6_NEPPI|nr:hypothetical protein NPIL_628791 [Nephila pilipes]
MVDVAEHFLSCGWDVEFFTKWVGCPRSTNKHYLHLEPSKVLFPFPCGEIDEHGQPQFLPSSWLRPHLCEGLTCGPSSKFVANVAFWKMSPLSLNTWYINTIFSQATEYKDPVSTHTSPFSPQKVMSIKFNRWLLVSAT